MGFLDRLLDILSRGQYASAEATRRVLDPQGGSGFDDIGAALSGAWAGATGRAKTSYSDVLDEHGVEGWQKTAGGLLGDIFLDPTTYVGAGALKSVAKQAAPELFEQAAWRRLSKGIDEAPLERLSQEDEVLPWSKKIQEFINNYNLEADEATRFGTTSSFSPNLSTSLSRWISNPAHLDESQMDNLRRMIAYGKKSPVDMEGIDLGTNPALFRGVQNPDEYHPVWGSMDQPIRGTPVEDWRALEPGAELDFDVTSWTPNADKAESFGNIVLKILEGQRNPGMYLRGLEDEFLTGGKFKVSSVYDDISELYQQNPALGESFKPTRRVIELERLQNPIRRRLSGEPLEPNMRVRGRESGPQSISEALDPLKKMFEAGLGVPKKMPLGKGEEVFSEAPKPLGHLWMKGKEVPGDQLGFGTPVIYKAGDGSVYQGTAKQVADITGDSLFDVLDEGYLIEGFDQGELDKLYEHLVGPKSVGNPTVNPFDEVLQNKYGQLESVLENYAPVVPGSITKPHDFYAHLAYGLKSAPAPSDAHRVDLFLQAIEESGLGPSHLMDWLTKVDDKTVQTHYPWLNDVIEILGGNAPKLTGNPSAVW